MANDNGNRKIMVSDPNGEGQNIINTEDLCIIVELETESKPRTTFAVKKGAAFINDYDGDSRKINFISGTEINGMNVLSTEYTNIGNYKAATAILKGNSEDFEALGISSIDISFNSSFAPLITINFIDVRGASIFEQGSSSKYKVFFEMPYPIFKLTIKGYFGHAVTYDLHLTKFNGRFNSKTGNFEVKCEFIGHTFAFLTDMLVGYLRAACETARGKELLAQKQKSDPNIISITDLMSGIGKINQSITKIKQDSDTIKKLSSVSDKVDKLNNLKDIINEFITTIVNNDTVNGRSNNLIAQDSNGLYILKDQTFPSFKYSSYIDNSSKLVKDINDFSSEKGELYTSITEINSNLEQSISINTWLYTNFVLFSGTVDSFRNNKNLSEKIDAEKYNFITDRLSDIEGNINIVVPDFSLALNDISNKITSLNSLKDGFTKDVSTELKERVSENITFRSDIKTVFSILCAHVEIFIELIRGVADSAKNNSNRYDKFKKYIDRLDIKDTVLAGKTIYPFPGYEKDGEEAWLGKDVSDIPETDFIEELLNGFLKTAEADKAFGTALNGEILNWYPTSVLDTKFFSIENPYNKIKETNSYKVLLDTIIKRGILNLHYTNTHITEPELNAVSKIEGLNILDNILSINVLRILTQKTTDELLADYTEYTENKFILSENSDSTSENTKSYFYYGDIDADGSSAGRYTSKNNTDTYSDYIKIISETEYDESAFGEYPSYDISDTKYSPTDKPLALYNVSADKLYLNPNSTPPNYDQLSGKYKVQEFFNVSTDGGTNSKDSHELFWSNLSKGSDIIYNCFGNIPNKNAELITNKLKNKVDTINKRYIGFQVASPNLVIGIPTIYSLFGSELYLRQYDNINVPHQAYQTFNEKLKVVEMSKAILFLHTLPFDGLVGNNGFGLFSELSESSIVGGYKSKGGLKRALFNKRGGFVKVPKGWVLLVGGLLWRYESVTKKELSKDPVIFSNGNNIFLQNITSTSNVPTVDQYLKTSAGDNHLYEPLAFSDDYSYISIEDIILDLPEQVKQSFINYFTDWVNGTGSFYDIMNWTDIKNIYELEDYSSITDPQSYQSFITQRESVFISARNATEIYKYSLLYNNQTDFEENLVTKETVTEITKNILSASNIFRQDVLDRCRLITCNFSSNGTNIAPRANFNIMYVDMINDTSEAKDAIDSIIDNSVIANTTWRIWGTKNDTLEYSAYYTDGFNVNERVMKSYLSSVIKTVSEKIGREEIKSKIDDKKKEVFGTIDNDTIKLNLYRTVKAIYDKWVSGTESGVMGIFNSSRNETVPLIDTFRFINKGYKDIGNEFLINPVSLYNELKFNTNQSFYDLISRILVSNNFDFIPMPTFIDFSNKNELSKIFEAITYKTFADNTNIGPSFICMYVGQPSKHLDIDGSFNDDSIQFRENDDTGLPKDFSDDGYNIPVFEVNYAKGNQSIFKDINLDQSEYSETDESLKIIDELSLQGDKLNRTPIGQNLFNVYSSRSYKAEVECMGNAMIQPMMYFQLNGIPMFRGGYLITNVKHNLRPNNMMTTFKGVRVNRTSTPLLTEGDLYMNLLGSYSDIDGSSVKINKTDEAWVINARNLSQETLSALSVLGNPISGDISISSNFGSRGSGKHKGIDLRTSVNTPILSLYNGTVELVRLSPINKNGTSYGLHMIVKYVIQGRNWYSLYAHLDDVSVLNLNSLAEAEKTRLVSGGITMDKYVSKGEVLGYTGGDKNSKKNIKGVYYKGKSTGPHLHFEIRDENADNKYTDINSIFFNNSTPRDPAQILNLVKYSTDTNINKAKES